MRRLLRLLLRGDREGLERARQADHRAAVELEASRNHGRHAARLMLRNHLTDHFLREMQRRGSA